MRSQKAQQEQMQKERDQVEPQRRDKWLAAPGDILERQLSGLCQQYAQGARQLSVEFEHFVRDVLGQEMPQFEVPRPRKPLAALCAIAAGAGRTAAWTG